MTDKYYVGQSLDIAERWHNHKSRLRNNKHTVVTLQEDYNKYGEDAFVYRVEKYIEPQFLNSLETHFMEFYNSVKSGYNINNTKVVIRKEDKDKQLAIQTLKYIDEMEEMYITVNAEDVKIVLLNYYNMCLMEAMYTDEHSGGVISSSLTHFITRGLTYDNSAILRYEVLLGGYICKYMRAKYPAIQIEGCEVVKVDSKEPNYRGIYVGYINNLLMSNSLKVGITYRGDALDESYYKELILKLNDSEMAMMWNVKKGL